MRTALRTVHWLIFGLGALVVVALALFVWPPIFLLLLAVVVVLIAIFVRLGRR